MQLSEFKRHLKSNGWVPGPTAQTTNRGYGITIITLDDEWKIRIDSGIAKPSGKLSVMAEVVEDEYDGLVVPFVCHDAFSDDDILDERQQIIVEQKNEMCDSLDAVFRDDETDLAIDDGDIPF